MCSSYSTSCIGTRLELCMIAQYVRSVFVGVDKGVSRP